MNLVRVPFNDNGLRNKQRKKSGRQACRQTDRHAHAFYPPPERMIPAHGRAQPPAHPPTEAPVLIVGPGLTGDV